MDRYGNVARFCYLVIDVSVYSVILYIVTVYFITGGIKMLFKITDHSVPVPQCEPQYELREALRSLRQNQSMNIPADYMQESKNKRTLIGVSCIRVGGQGAFSVRKQKDGSFEVYRIK
jgi:hypothetical protein